MHSITLLAALVLGQATPVQAPLVLEAEAPGLSDQDLEKSILIPLEASLASAKEILRMHGLVRGGKCLMRLDLRDDADPQQVRAEVLKRIASFKPASSLNSKTQLLPPAESEFMLIALEPSPFATVVDVTRNAKRTLLPALAKILGIAQLRVMGDMDNEVSVRLNPDRLQAYNLSLDQVKAVLKGDPSKKNRTIEDVKNLMISESSDSQVIFLRDLGVVELAERPRDSVRALIRTKDGVQLRRNVLILMQLSPGKGHARAKQALERVIEDARTKLPAGALIHTEFVQKQDTTVVVRLPEGMAENRGFDRDWRASEAMMEIPEVNKVFWIAPRVGNEVVFYVRSTAADRAGLHKSLRGKMSKFPEVGSRVVGLYAPVLAWPDEGSQFVIRLVGKDMSKLQKTALELRKLLGDAKGFVDLDHFPRMERTVRIEFDKEKLAALKLLSSDVRDPLLAGKEQPIPGWPWPVSVSVPLPEEARQRKPDALGKVPVRWVNERIVLLRDVASIKSVNVIGGAMHENGRACVVVYGNLEGRTSEQARTEIRRISQRLSSKDAEIEVE